MTWTNGEVTVGDIGHGQWQYHEMLHVTGPDTPFPGGGHFSPHTVTLTYSYGAGGWSLPAWDADGPLLSADKEILEEEVTVVGDRDFMYPEHSTPDGPSLPTPAWITRLAVSRVQLLPAPPGVQA